MACWLHICWLLPAKPGYCQILGNLVDRFFGFSKFQTLSEARSQLYQRRFLRPRRHFFSVFRALHFFPCTVPDFCDFWKPLHRFLFKKTEQPKNKSPKLPRIWEYARRASKPGASSAPRRTPAQWAWTYATGASSEAALTCSASKLKGDELFMQWPNSKI